MTHTNNAFAISVSCAIIHVPTVLHQTNYAVTNPVRAKFINMKVNAVRGQPFGFHLNYLRLSN